MFSFNSKFLFIKKQTNILIFAAVYLNNVENSL